MAQRLALPVLALVLSPQRLRTGYHDLRLSAVDEREWLEPNMFQMEMEQLLSWSRRLQKICADAESFESLSHKRRRRVVLEILKDPHASEALKRAINENPTSVM